MTTIVINRVKAVALFALGLAVAAMGLYVGEADDAPGAGGLGLLLMVAGVALGLRAWRNQLPVRAARAALAVGVVAAAFAASLTHGVAVSAPLFPLAVPSVTDAAPSPRHATAAVHARELVRDAVVEQNLPGVSVAVGVGGALVWAEGFGWRDVATQAPVTPVTRFNIGTAASTVTAAVAPLGLAHSGTDSAADWSPEHTGEPEEDFPLFSLIRRVVLQPLGVAPAQPLSGERATFYVPRSNDNPAGGRRLMNMRDLACCANGMAFSSTPSDLVRVGLVTRPDSVNGELAGGMVTSLVTARGGDVVVAVSANIAHADTASLARRIGEAFSRPTR